MTNKTLPYVYMLTHKITGQFYYGFRCANKVPSSEDFGIRYFTSSKTVKNNFTDYEYLILAEFFDADSAYQFEQSLIEENFNNPLILNKHYQKTKKYSMLGFKRPDLSDYNTKTKSKEKENRVYFCSQCNSKLLRIEFKHHSAKNHYFCDSKCKNRFSASKRQSTKGISKPRKEGYVVWNKGLSNPNAATNGKKGATKLATTVSGRKRYIISPTEWTWQYPDGSGGWYIKQNGKKIPVL